MGEAGDAKANFYKFYDIERVSSHVAKSGFRRVACQFPDDLLSDAPGVVSTLTREAKNKIIDGGKRPLFFVAGDTNFGACCVDEVSADHYGADCVVHFGPSCQSSTMRLPVIHVYCARATDTHVEDHMARVTRSLTPAEEGGSGIALVITEVGHDHLRDCVTNALLFGGKFKSVRVALPKNLTHAPAPPAGVDGVWSDVAMKPYSSLGCVCSAMSATMLRQQRIKNVPGRGELPWIPKFSFDNSKCDFTSRKSTDEKTADGQQDLVYHDPTSICGRLMYSALPVFSSKGERESELIRVDDSENTLPDGSTIVYVGPRGDPLKTRLLLRYGSSHSLLVLDPTELCPKPEQAGADKTTPRGDDIQPEQPFSLQMKRFGCVEAAKSAELFGIVYGTTGVSHCDAVVKRINDILLARGRRVYNLVVGDVNITKLGNFPEIECYVHVACPENQWALSVSNRDYPVPIITPFELEVAMEAREWSTEYVVEFSELLSTPPKEPEQDDEGELNVQVLGGGAKVKNFKLEQDHWERFYDKLLPHQDRGYAGVRPNDEIPAPELPVQGDHGVASCYTNTSLGRVDK